MPPEANYCFLWIDWWPMCMGMSAWASWVQAFGSIGAIYFTMRAVNHGHKLERRRLAEDQQSQQTVFLASVSMLITGLVATAERVFREESQGVARSPLHLEALQVELESFASALRRVDVCRLDSQKALVTLILADEHAHMLLATVRRIAAPGYAASLEGPLLQNMAHNTAQGLGAAAKMLAAEVKERGSVLLSIESPFN